MHLTLIVYHQIIAKKILNLLFVLLKSVPVYHNYLMFPICLLWVIRLIINVYSLILTHFWLKLKIFLQQQMILNLVELISFVFSLLFCLFLFFFSHLNYTKQRAYVSSRTVQFIVQKKK